MEPDEAKKILLNAFLSELDAEQTKIFQEFRGKPECDEKMEDILIVNQWTMYENIRDQGYLNENKENDDLDESYSEDGNDDVTDISSDVEADCYVKSEADQAIESNTVDYTDRMNEVKERLPQNLKILLLGESGAGRSTFINSFVNFLKYTSFSEAKKGNTEIVIPMEISYADDERESHTLEVEQSLDHLYESTTFPEYQGVTEYEIPMIDHKSLTFYDTTGFLKESDDDTNDTGFEDALRFAKNESIDVILVLLHPERARLTPMFEIFLSKTMRSCNVDKIRFIYTHSQATNLRFGNTYSILKEYISKEKIAITDLKQRSFCFENNPFKFLWLMKNKNLQLENSQERDLERNWNHSMDQTIKLLDRICTIKREEIVDETPIAEPKVENDKQTSEGGTSESRKGEIVEEPLSILTKEEITETKEIVTSEFFEPSINSNDDVEVDVTASGTLLEVENTSGETETQKVAGNEPNEPRGQPNVEDKLHPTFSTTYSDKADSSIDKPVIKPQKRRAPPPPRPPSPTGTPIKAADGVENYFKTPVVAENVTPQQPSKRPKQASSSSSELRDVVYLLETGKKNDGSSAHSESSNVIPIEGRALVQEQPDAVPPATQNGGPENENNFEKREAWPMRWAHICLSGLLIAFCIRGCWPKVWTGFLRFIGIAICDDCDIR